MSSPPSARTAAKRTHDQHVRVCDRCAKDPTLCDTRRALRRLALEGRR
jgi:hypothetical protein